MTLPNIGAVSATCPECEDVRLKLVSNKNTPDMHHDFKQVVVERCPKCGIEVTITTTIDVVRPTFPQKERGIYLPPGVKPPKGYT